MRALARVAAVSAAAVVAVVAVVGASPAHAHPLGNFSVNTAAALEVRPDGFDVHYVVDLAELPTVQARRDIAGTGLRRWSRQQCTSLAHDVTISAAGVPVRLHVRRSAAVFRPGQGGLRTLRLTCTWASGVTGPTSGRVTVVDRNYRGRVGWREITAVGDGTILSASTVPARSPSAQLTAYPDDLLSSPLRVTRARMLARPGGTTAATDSRGAAGVAAEAPFASDRFTARFTTLVAERHLTVAFAMFAVAVALALGAIHALAPGHGKTVMAAYLVGQRGSRRDAVLIAATVTLTHTAGVLILGLVLSSTRLVATDRLYPMLAVLSGALIAGLGVALVVRAARGWRLGRFPLVLPPVDTAPRARSCLAGIAAGVAADPAVAAAHPAARTHAFATAPAGTLPVHHHPGGHGHDRHDHHHHDEHGHDGIPMVVDAGWHTHGGVPHRHAVPGADAPLSWRSLVTLGVAGGLVPTPSALVVLLGAIALGRAWFGLLLIVIYGLGMAVTLTTAGLLLARSRDVIERRMSAWHRARTARALRALPLVTASLIVVAGLVVAARGLAAGA